MNLPLALIAASLCGAAALGCSRSPAGLATSPLRADIPPAAKTVNNIQSEYAWYMTDDPAAGDGIATGTMNLVNGTAREFHITYQNFSAERFWSSFGADAFATNFTYDADVYVVAPSDTLADIEFDMNQVMSNGQTVIFGVQCDGYSSTWEYFTNAGSPEDPVNQWQRSPAACNPRNWATNLWHHVQLSYSRDSLGVVTYKTVTFDGTVNEINETVPSSFVLGWEQTLLTNFQLDGLGSYGSATVYLDNLTISRW